MWYFTLFHGLKLGFEFIPAQDSQAWMVVVELVCFRLVMIFGINPDDFGAA